MPAGVLVTGFEPFDGDARNLSWEVAARLDGLRLAGTQTVRALRLPCEFGRSGDLLLEALSARRPALVLALGQDNLRDAIQLECRAENLDDARIPDNAGRQPRALPVVAGGAPWLSATLPLSAMDEALAGQGMRAELSSSAGRYVCNHVFYRLLDAVAGDVPAGFVHLPRPPSGGNDAHAGRLATALAHALEAALATRPRPA